LADTLDGGVAVLQGLGDAAIGPGGAALGGIGLEEDAGMGRLHGCGLAGGDQVLESLTLFGGQRDDVLLQVVSPVAIIAPRELIPTKSSSHQWRTTRL
jgi:hypothetical protein